MYVKGVQNELKAVKITTTWQPAKPEVIIAQVVIVIGTLFQRLSICFGGHLAQQREFLQRPTSIDAGNNMAAYQARSSYSSGCVTDRNVVPKPESILSGLLCSKKEF